MKMKRFFTVLITLLVSLFFAPNIFSQDTVVRIERSLFTLPDIEGEIFSVDIVIEDGQNVAGCQIWLTYNSTALEYHNSKEGAFFPDTTFYGEMHRDTHSPTEMRLRFVVVTSPLSQHNGDGDIITLFFKVLDGNHPFLLNLVAGDLSNETGTLLSDADGNLSLPQIEELPDLIELPDLVVESVSANKTILAFGETFTLTATLKNKGVRRVNAPIHYRWHRATHPNFHSMTDDERVSTGATEKIGEEHTVDKFSSEFKVDLEIPLAADQSSEQLINITAPEELGTYYYHVCVESSPDEGNPNNNCSNDVKITVLPDLTGDGSIDENDFLIVVAQFGLDSAPATTGATKIINITDIDPIVKEIYLDYKVSGVISDFSIAVTTHADLNNDGIVDFADIKFMAEALADAGVFAAPNAARLTPDTVEQWMMEAKQMWESDPASFHGIAALEQFHTRLPPLTTALLSNYPNPFNPETWIPYHLAKPADVTLTIYDVNGHIVRTLDVGHQRAGRYQDRARAAYWDGRNTHGEPVASGVYFYMLSAGDFTATRRMLIRK